MGGEAVVEVLDGLEARTGGDGRNRQRGGFEEMLGGGDPCGHYLALHGRAEDALEHRNAPLGMAVKLVGDALAHPAAPTSDVLDGDGYPFHPAVERSHGLNFFRNHSFRSQGRGRRRRR